MTRGWPIDPFRPIGIIVRRDCRIELRNDKYLEQLVPLPSVALELMRVAADSDADFHHMANLIARDTAFSAEVLRTANSVLLGCSRQIDSILRALAMIGLDRVKSTVMTVAVRNFVARMPHLPGVFRCWEHSLGCALICEQLGTLFHLSRDACYTAGLLHDIGRFALFRASPAEYDRLLREEKESDPGLLFAERELFGVDHCEVGRRLAACWLFPDEFLDATGRHHNRPLCRYIGVTGLVQSSCRIADGFGFAVSAIRPLSTFDLLPDDLPALLQQYLNDNPQWREAVATRIAESGMNLGSGPV